MRLIDADALIMNLDDRYSLRDISREYRDTVVYELENAPIIDAVEVVRCKDCAKREYCRTTNVWATVPDDDWFCADAERRSDDGV